MLPWTQRYLDEVSRLGGSAGMLASGSFMRAMFPTTGDQAFLDRARAIAAEEGVDPTLRSVAAHRRGHAGAGPARPRLSGPRVTDPPVVH